MGGGLVAIMVTAGLVWPRLLPCMPACCPLVCGPPCWAPPLWWMCAALVGPGSGSCAGPRGLSPPWRVVWLPPCRALVFLCRPAWGVPPLAGGAMPSLLGLGAQFKIAVSTAAHLISLLLSSPHRLKTTGLAARHQALMVVFSRPPTPNWVRPGRGWEAADWEAPVRGMSHPSGLPPLWDVPVRARLLPLAGCPGGGSCSAGCPHEPCLQPPDG